MTILSLNPIFVPQCMMIPILTFPLPLSSKHGGDDAKHRHKYKHVGWNRKKAQEKLAREQALLAEIQRQWRIIRGLPAEELGINLTDLEKIVPKVVHKLTEQEQLDRLATITRGEASLLQAKYFEYQKQLDEYNERVIQQLLSQIL